MYIYVYIRIPYICIPYIYIYIYIYMVFTTDGLLVGRELTSTVNLSHQQYQAKADAKNNLRKEKPKKS